MDESDPTISFDDTGLCTYCQHTLPIINKPREVWPGDLPLLKGMKKEIKSRSKNSDFDCIIGLSGGLDSSFLAHLAVSEMGLKPLLVHVDAGWNNATAVSNVAKISKALNLDLHTIIYPWSVMRELQLSFFKSGLPHLDVPQDSAFFSCLYEYATKFKIKSVLTGANLMTESVREPFSWGAYPGNDPVFINSVYQETYNKPLSGVNIISSLKSRIIYRHLFGMKIFKPLNDLKYSKSMIENLLQDNYGWESFSHKHHESRLTKFVEAYWLPKVFGVDRRKAHLSSLILSGNLDRNDALKELLSPSYSLVDIEYDFHFIADKLEISFDEFIDILNSPIRPINDFKSSEGLYKFLARLQNIFTSEKRLYK
jgi:N-acetyl sugar amidotransferase